MRKKLVFNTLAGGLFFQIRNQRGVALLVLLSFVLTMSPMVMYLMDDSLKSHQIAVNTVSRLKSFYLARSAVNMSKLILYYNKAVQEKVAASGASAANVGGLSEPLYRQIPLDTEMLRGLLEGAASTIVSEEDESLFENEDTIDKTETDGLGSATTDESQDEESELGGASEQLGGMNAFDKDKANDFLAFDGNFRSTITEEYAKYSLNTISQIETTSLSYDIYKRLLLNLLMHADFKGFFEEQERDAEKLVHAIGDYIDSNSSVNEFEQHERGNESDDYSELDYKAKNAKFLSLSELRMVPGMTDQIYLALEPYVTVYQTEAAINVCLADPEILKQLILLYTTYAECTKPLDPDNEEEITDLLDQVLSMCPDKDDMADVLNTALGLKDDTTTDSEETTTATETSTSTTTSSSSSSSKITGCKVQFVDFLSEKNDIFTIAAEGQIDDVKTEIKMVINASATSAKSWTVLYYSVY